MGKTVKCRIALAVDPSGLWAATGDCGIKDDSWEAHDYILDSLEPGEARYWVEVEVPVPSSSVTVIRAEAKEAQ